MRKLPRCGTGDRAKNTHCELSSFGPALFEIWWPDIYLGGPYGPVTDKMYWPELVRRSEKCAGPAGQCLCRGLQQDKKWNDAIRNEIFTKLQNAIVRFCGNEQSYERNNYFIYNLLTPELASSGILLNGNGSWHGATLIIIYVSRSVWRSSHSVLHRPCRCTLPALEETSP